MRGYQLCALYMVVLIGEKSHLLCDLWWNSVLAHGSTTSVSRVLWHFSCLPNECQVRYTLFVMSGGYRIVSALWLRHETSNLVPFSNVNRASFLSPLNFEQTLISNIHTTVVKIECKRGAVFWYCIYRT